MNDFSIVASALFSVGWSVVWQSALCLAIGAVLCRLLTRRPARAGGVLLAAMVAALAAPIGSLVIREQGWGVLPSPAQDAARAQSPAAAKSGEILTDARPMLDNGVMAREFDGSMSDDSGFSSPRSALPTLGAAARNDASGQPPASSRQAPRRAKSLVDWTLIGRGLLYVWCALSVVALVRLAMSFWAGIRLVSETEPVDDARLTSALSLAASRLGTVARAIPRVSSHVRCPVIWCWSRRPVVLLPPSFVERTSESAWAAVFCHELAHWKRRDHLASLTGQLLCCLLPWQPLAWWARRRQEQLSELACDEWVVASGHLPETYAEALLDLVPQRRAGLALAVVGSRSGLRGRIEHILKMKVVQPRLGVRWLAGLAALTIGLVSIVALAQQRPQAAAAEGKPEPPAADNRPDSQPVAAAGGEESTPTQSIDELLKLAGTVLLPDGSPAVGARVAAHREHDQPPIVVHTDAAGWFEIYGMFGNALQLHVANADGSLQGWRWVAGPAARTALQSPVEVKLAPATVHEVTVLSEGKPVEGVYVSGTGSAFVDGIGELTGPDGKVRLKIPAGMELKDVVAWHPTLGVDGARSADKPDVDLHHLSLRAPAVHTIQVVDPDGKPVGGVELAVSFRIEDDGWIATGNIQAAHVRTDAAGVATTPWAPRDELANLDVEIVDLGWKEDETDHDEVSKGRSTVHVRRLKAVEGRLIMPEGASAEGILVSGFGFGPDHQGDIPYARARRDGTFTLHVPSDHGYVLGVVDNQWGSDLWSGTILETDDAKPEEIAIKTYPATPVMVRVTRGDDHTPVADAWVYLGRIGDVKMKTPKAGKAEPRSGRGGPSDWLRTDEKGIARGGVGLGEMKVRLTAGQWQEERTIEVTSTEPIEIEFHRDWLGDRKVSGQLTLDGQPFRPASPLFARAWSERPQTVSGGIINRRQYSPLPEPNVGPDGTFLVDFDSENLTLLFIDYESKTSGFASLDGQESKIEIAMQPMATLAGTLLGTDAKPLVGWTVRLRWAGFSFLDRSQPSDEAGQFLLAGIPGNLPVQLIAEDESQLPNRAIYGQRRLFVPGEQRTGEVIADDRTASSLPRSPNAVPLSGLSYSPSEVPLFAAKAAKICHWAALGHMRGLAILSGDGSDGVRELARKIADFQNFKSVLPYSPIAVKAEETEARVLAELGWPTPKAGEVVLVVLDGEGKGIASERIEASDVAAGLKLAATFLDAHKLPTRDARALVDEARKEAAASGRRVWFVLGGPRCGPCFLLAGWMEVHREVLAKDYVIAKVMGDLDENADAVIAEFRPNRAGGVPWFAIAEPDGKILVTSDGPLDNIGMPSTIESIRYFRQMLEQTAKNITPTEIDGLIGTLTPKR